MRERGVRSTGGRRVEKGVARERGVGTHYHPQRVNYYDNRSRAVKCEGIRVRYRTPEYLKGTTKIFFTNFPNDCGMEDMWRVFAHWGIVKEVFIAKKKDRFGHRFGFVCFKDISDTSRLIANLNNIRLGGSRLIANTPRFNRELNERINTKQRFKNAVNQRNNSTREGISFAAAVKEDVRTDKVGSFDGVKNNKRFQNFKAKQDNEWRGISFTTDKNSLRWLERSYVGVTYCLEDVFSMQEKLDKGGFFPLKAIPMGGKLVLITANDEVDIKATSEEDEDSFARLFEELRPWDNKTVSRERFLWLKIQGLPVQAWEEVSFRTIAGMMGTYIRMDDDTTKKMRLDIARILISASSPETIFRNMTVKIDQHLFNIRISEDLCGDVSVSERRNQLYQMASSSSSEECDAISFDGSWVSETPELGGKGAEREQGVRRGGVETFSNSVGGQKLMGECDTGYLAVKSVEIGAESALYENLETAASSEGGQRERAKWCTKIWSRDLLHVLTCMG